MIKIKSIKFKEHPILGNLHLDFCDKNGNPADTIIIAGENGTGKTTILEEIHKIMKYECDCACLKLEVICNNKPVSVEYSNERNTNNKKTISVFNYYYENKKFTDYQGICKNFKNIVQFNDIYASVNINFSPDKKIKNIADSALDNENKNNEKFNEETSQNIKQLFIDITNYDNKIIADNLKQLVANKQNMGINNITLIETEKLLHGRMDRFKNAFNFMFDNINYKGIDNRNENIEILFNKNSKDITIDELSSGEKQIVFRGAFLLRDKEALNGAVVLIDEPEISMHPEWQKKIMDFYKEIFQNQNDEQTSQIIVTTHSPFIIHNENRYNDKVIILKHDENGGVVVSDKPEYYQANTVQAVEDAFNIQNFLSNTNENIVFVEGKTDEQYFNKAVEVFNIKNLPFIFKWIGYIGKNNQEEFTGKDSLYQAYSFLKGHSHSGKKVFLYDCDTNKQDEDKNNCYTRSITKQNNSKEIKAGIENALKLDNINNFKDFFKDKIDKGNYGENKIIPKFQKQEFCNYICSLDNEQLKIILSNLKTEIEKLREIFKQ